MTAPGESRPLERAKRRTRHNAVWLVAIAGSALVLRVSVAWQYSSQPLGQFAWVDEASYVTWAQAILRGGWWPVRPFYQDPFYPYALACLMKCVGPDIGLLRVISAGLGALTPVVVALAGMIGLGRAEGWVAGWLTAFYGPLVFSDGSLEKEGLAAFWTAVSLLATALVYRKPTVSLAALAGAAWGIVGLLRSNALLMLPLTSAWLTVGARSKATRSDRHTWVAAAGCLVGGACVVVPVAAINTSISNPHEWMGTTWQLGPNFFIGNGPDATGTYMAPSFVRANPAYEAADYAAEAMRRSKRALTPGQISNFWLREGLNQWREAPLSSFTLLTRKLTLVSHHSEIPDSQDMEFVEIVAAPALAFGFVSFGLIFPLAAIALARPSRDGYFSFLIIATALGLLATAIFFVVGRYRVPWVPGLTLIAASGLIDLVRTVRNQDWSGLAWRVFLLGTPATFLTWHGMEDPAPARWSNQLVSTALAELRTGRLEQAINALDLARASGPDGADKVRSLLSESPVHDLLAELVGRKTERMPIASPSDPRASIAVARYLRQLPETEGRAFAMLEQALRMVPDDRDANRELALHQLVSQPDSEDTRGRALKALEAASRGSTPDPSAILYLALQRSDPSLMDEMDGRGLPEWRTTIKLVRAMIASRPKRPRSGSRS